jgi:hypothetical protein
MSAVSERAGRMPGVMGFTCSAPAGAKRYQMQIDEERPAKNMCNACKHGKAVHGLCRFQLGVVCALRCTLAASSTVVEPDSSQSPTLAHAAACIPASLPTTAAPNRLSALLWRFLLSFLFSSHVCQDVSTPLLGQVGQRHGAEADRALFGSARRQAATLSAPVSA